MRSLLMLSWSFGCAVDFDKHKAGRIRLLLDHIEPDNARFLHTVASIIKGGGFESLDGVGFDMDKNMDDEHSASFLVSDR